MHWIQGVKDGIYVEQQILISYHGCSQWGWRPGHGGNQAKWLLCGAPCQRGRWTTNSLDSPYASLGQEVSDTTCLFPV